MKKIVEFLRGRKTYLVAILVGLNHVGVMLGFWTWDQAMMVNSILAPFGLAFIRAAIDKTGASGPK